MITIKRGSSKVVRLEWFEGAADTSPRMDCTGMACLVQETTLPWDPQIAVVDIDTGLFDLTIATRSQSLEAETGRTYEIAIALDQAGDTGLVPDQNIGVQFV